MVLSQIEKDRAKDKRLQRKFRITLERHNEIARKQDNKCKICGGDLFAYGSPAVDHFHFKVSAHRISDGDVGFESTDKWKAQGFTERGCIFVTRYAKTKTAAITIVKKIMMPWSVRGLLCVKCNRGVGCVEKLFNASRYPENLLPVIEYLKARLKS